MPEKHSFLLLMPMPVLRQDFVHTNTVSRLNLNSYHAAQRRIINVANRPSIFHNFSFYCSFNRTLQTILIPQPKTQKQNVCVYKLACVCMWVTNVVLALLISRSDAANRREPPLKAFQGVFESRSGRTYKPTRFRAYFKLQWARVNAPSPSQRGASLKVIGSLARKPPTTELNRVSVAMPDRSRRIRLFKFTDVTASQRPAVSRSAQTCNKIKKRGT